MTAHPSVPVLRRGPYTVWQEGPNEFVVKHEEHGPVGSAATAQEAKWLVDDLIRDPEGR